MGIHIERVSGPEGLYILTPDRFQDDRGYFSETYKASLFEDLGLTVGFIQDNHSYSRHKGTVRGLHFQSPPYAQAKLVSTSVGAVLDIVVDIRRDSPTYGQHVSVELSAENGRQFFIPAGFAHGFCTLTDHAEIRYKVSAPYAKDHDGGIFWDDPDIGIVWPVESSTAILSEKDRNLPRLRECLSPFS